VAEVGREHDRGPAGRIFHRLQIAAVVLMSILSIRFRPSFADHFESNSSLYIYHVFTFIRLIFVYSFLGETFCPQTMSGVNPTIARYSARVVNFYNATDSLAKFENKKYFILCTLKNAVNSEVVGLAPEKNCPKTFRPN
jgi:hypothetical protein